MGHPPHEQNGHKILTLKMADVETLHAAAVRLWTRPSLGPLLTLDLPLTLLTFLHPLSRHPWALGFLMAPAVGREPPGVLSALASHEPEPGVKGGLRLPSVRPKLTSTLFPLWEAISSNSHLTGQAKPHGPCSGPKLPCVCGVL